MFKKVLSISLVATMALSTASFAAGAFDQFKKDVRTAGSNYAKTVKSNAAKTVDAKSQAKIDKINKQIAEKQAEIKKIQKNKEMTAQKRVQKISKLNSQIKDLRADIAAIRATATK